MKENGTNKLLITCVGLLLAAFCIWCLFKPSDTISASERRKLQEKPSLTIEKVMSGKYMKEFEEYASDQFPMRDTFRSIKVWFAKKVLRQTDQNGVYFEDGHLSKLEYPFDEESVLNAASQFEGIYRIYLKDANTQVYLSLVPDKNYYLAGQNHYPSMDYDMLLQTMQDNTSDFQYVDVVPYLELADYYFTDPHWRQEKIQDLAEYLAKEMAQDDNAMGIASGEITYAENHYAKKTLEDPFYGVYAGQYGLKIPGEDMIYLDSEILQGCSVFDYESNKEISVYDMAKAKGLDSYELFLSGSKSLLRIDNPKGPEGKRLILFRDSFGSSIAPLLVPYYEEIVLIDIRYIQANLLGKFVDFQDADVLFLYSTLVLNNSITLKGNVQGAVVKQKDAIIEAENGADELAGTDGLASEEETFKGLVQNLRVNFVENPVGIDSQSIWFSWETDFEQKAYEITVLNADTDDTVWQSGRVDSNETINIAYAGELLEDCTSYEYSVLVYDENDHSASSKTGYFTTAFLSQSPFDEAKFICLPDGVKGNGDGQACFYQSFKVQDRAVKKVWFFGSSLGIYEAWMNEEPIGDDLWKPGWTEFRKTLLYNTYDVTDAVKVGEENIVTVMVNDGWWNGDNAFGSYGKHKPAFVGRILVEYEDGSSENLYTDENWMYETDTQIRYADFFQGETRNLNKKEPWQLTAEAIEGQGEDELQGEELGSERPAKLVSLSTIFKGTFHSTWMATVKEKEDRIMSPVDGYVYEGAEDNGSTYGLVHKIQEQVDLEDGPVTLSPGQILIVDLGQNIAGIPDISFEAEAGTEIHLQFAEMLNDRGSKSAGNDGPEGSLYRANYRAAKTKVNVIASDAKKEHYKSTFFFTGFRYISVEATGPVTIYDLKGIGTGNDSKEIGGLSTDYAKINRLFQNVEWSQRNNYTMIATDCPQRDERLGWMGDLQSFAKTSLYNQDLYSFYRKWEHDLVDSQQGDGSFTDTSPTTVNTGAGNAGWADAGIFVPWAVYSMYGNTEQLEYLYEPMTRYMEFLEKRSNFTAGGAIGAKLAYGDWLAKENTDKEFLAALWYAEDALVMEKIAKVLSKEEDAYAYRQLYAKICHFIVERYVGNPVKLSQTEMCFLLRYKILREVDAKLEKPVEEALAQSVEKNEYRLMTGFAGTPILLQTLTDMGRVDLAYKVLTCEENPSWLYSVNQGATSIWERYDSYTLEKGFASAAMNSFDHFNEGSVAQWMYESMLGIRVDLSEEVPIQIAPCLPPDDVDIHEAEGTFHSVYGEIEVSWKMKEGMLEIDVTVPYNTSTKVSLPIEGFEEEILYGGSYHYEGKMQ